MWKVATRVKADIDSRGTLFFSSHLQGILKKAINSTTYFGYDLIVVGLLLFLRQLIVKVTLLAQERQPSCPFY